MTRKIEGIVVINNEPCFEDFISILLNNYYDINIKRINNNELEIKYSMDREV